MGHDFGTDDHIDNGIHLESVYILDADNLALSRNPKLSLTGDRIRDSNKRAYLDTAISFVSLVSNESIVILWLAVSSQESFQLFCLLVAQLSAHSWKI